MKRFKTKGIRYRVTWIHPWRQYVCVRHFKTEKVAQQLINRLIKRGLFVQFRRPERVRV